MDLEFPDSGDFYEVASGLVEKYEQSLATLKHIHAKGPFSMFNNGNQQPMMSMKEIEDEAMIVFTHMLHQTATLWCTGCKLEKTDMETNLYSYLMRI